MFAVRLAEVHAKRRCWPACAAALSECAAALAAAPRDPAGLPARALADAEAARVAGDAARWRVDLPAARAHYAAAQRAVAAALADGSEPAGGDGAAGGGCRGRARAQTRRRPCARRGRGAGRPPLEPVAEPPGGAPEGPGAGRLAWALRTVCVRAALGRAKCAAAAGDGPASRELAARALACLSPSPAAGLAGRQAGASNGAGPDEALSASAAAAPVAAAAVLVFQAARLGDQCACADCAGSPGGPDPQGGVGEGAGRGGDEPRSPSARADAASGGTLVRLWGCHLPGTPASAEAAAAEEAGGRPRSRASAGAAGARGSPGAEPAAPAAAAARLRLLLRALALGGGAPLLARCGRPRCAC